jgi:hypothetical protein
MTEARIPIPETISIIVGTNRPINIQVRIGETRQTNILYG